MSTFKLSLDNFQAISSGELEFKTGLNFIIGQSNSGKTATFRAVKDCLLNPSKAARHIKNGNSQATVTIEYNDNVITWKRMSSSSVYEINGQEYIKVGRSNAFKLLENETGFVLGSSGIIMNIEEELQAPFPFGMTKQDLFKLYEDVFCISDSAVILKAAKGQEEQIKFEISNLENENIKNNKKIEELEKFKKEVDLEVLQSYKDKLKASQGRLLSLKTDLPNIKIAAQLETFEIPEVQMSFVDVSESYKDKVNLKVLCGKLKELHKLSTTLKDEFEITEGLISKRNSLLKLSNEIKVLKQLSDLPKIEDVKTESLTFRYNELNEIQKTAQLLSKLKDIKVPMFSCTADFQRYREMAELSNQVKNIEKEIKEKEGKLKITNESLEKLSNSLKEFKVCPLCHKPLD